jgi:hypothetical protein
MTVGCHRRELTRGAIYGLRDGCRRRTLSATSRTGALAVLDKQVPPRQQVRHEGWGRPSQRPEVQGNARQRLEGWPVTPGRAAGLTVTVSQEPR